MDRSWELWKKNVPEMKSRPLQFFLHFFNPKKMLNIHEDKSRSGHLGSTSKAPFRRKKPERESVCVREGVRACASENVRVKVCEWLCACGGRERGQFI